MSEDPYRGREASLLGRIAQLEEEKAALEKQVADRTTEQVVTQLNEEAYQRGQTEMLQRLYRDSNEVIMEHRRLEAKQRTMMLFTAVLFILGLLLVPVAIQFVYGPR